MKKITSILMAALMCSVLFTACAGQQGAKEGEKPVVLQPLTGIVVMPTVVEKGALSAARNSEATLGSVAGFMNEVLKSELGKNDQVHLVTEGQLDGLLTDAAGGRLAQMKALGDKMGSNAVLDVIVTRFQERDGSELSANAPASAAFDMVLTQVDSGKVLWAAAFDETQEAVASNLLSIGKVKNRGLKWISVEELVRQGVKERLAECPYLQK